MDRLLVVRCPGLFDQNENGTALRSFIHIIEAAEVYCPWITVVRPGICSLPVRGPARYFGGEQALVDLLHQAVAARRAETTDETAGELPDLTVEVGVADGLFAALLAAPGGAVIPPDHTPAYLATFPVAILGDTDLADLLARLGIRTLGDFAALPERHVLGRFGTHGMACHRVASGQTGELPGIRLPATARQVDEIRRGKPAPVRQSGFWGGMSDADARAGRALVEVQRLLGTDAVVTAHLQGGRGPGEQARLVTWGGIAVSTGDAAAPWPGRIPPPAPMVIHRAPCRAEVADTDGHPINVSSRGLLTGVPARLSVEGGPWHPIEAWAGPWPSDDRWWSRSRRRTVRMQIVTDDDTRLVLAERGHWWIEATYG